MKNSIKIFFVLVVTLIGVVDAFAGPTPPEPGARRPPPPPGLPIDESIFGLALFALLFGIYIIYKYQLKTKAPI